MRAAVLASLVLCAGLSLACAGHDDDRQWTKEELQELEDKWGYDVRCSPLLHRTAIYPARNEAHCE